jgi:large subunit ribosomal protein L19
MALKISHKDVVFGVGDTVRVHLSISEGDKKRMQVFEGMVIAIRGRGENKNFIVRRIGSAQIGIEKIFPINAPVIDSVQVVRAGLTGVRRAKLYYTRGLAKKEVEKIYRRSTKKVLAAKSTKKKVKKTAKPFKKKNIKSSKKKA